MMRHLLAVLLVVATPAWAANEAYPGMRPTTVEEWKAALEVCRRVETSIDICAMKNAPTETQALETAQVVLNWCEANVGEVSRCSAARAYIKQRWGN